MTGMEHYSFKSLCLSVAREDVLALHGHKQYFTGNVLNQKFKEARGEKQNQYISINGKDW